MTVDMTNTSADDGHRFYDDVLCDIENLTTTQEDDIDDLIDSCKFYLEGVALTPISIVGILGKFRYECYKVFLGEEFNSLKL